MKFFHCVFSAAVGVLVLSAATSALADQGRLETKPAVSEINGKLSVLGSTSSFGDIYGVDGSFSAPLGHSLGLQIDGLAARLDTDNLDSASAFGAGTHLFWRDPDRGLLGVYGHYVTTDAADSVSFRAIGFEAEAYLDRYTLSAIIGAEGGRISGTEFGQIDYGTNIFSSAFLYYYPTDDLSLSVGHRYVLKQNLIQAGAEWMPRYAALGDSSLYMAFSYDTDDETTVLVGLQRYFGQKGKSLIRRHREDDPQVSIMWIVHQAVGDLDNIIQTIREFRGG